MALPELFMKFRKRDNSPPFPWSISPDVVAKNFCRPCRGFSRTIYSNEGFAIEKRHGRLVRVIEALAAERSGARTGMSCR